MGLVVKRHKRNFQGDDNILCTDRGLNHTGVYICQQLGNIYLGFVHFIYVFERKKNL